MSSALKVLISGASGLIGTKLSRDLQDAGHDVYKLVRRPPQASEIRWYPDQGILATSLVEGMDAIVHLSGENIAKGRWTKAKKQRIRDSRINATNAIANCIERMDPPPKVLISASATGYYGDRGEQQLEEDAEAGQGFLADLCREWEAATEPARRVGVRVVTLRIGVVLSAQGGALAAMLLPFRLGVGGIVGSGQQYWSWITLDDLIAVIQRCLTDDALSGPVNAVSPNPVTNRQFTKTLGRVLHRPTFLPVPSLVAKVALGEMASELLLSSTRVIPRKLIDAGFPFRYGELESALQHCLSRQETKTASGKGNASPEAGIDV